MSLESFKSLFKYDPSKMFHIGVERECFITDRAGAVIPAAERVLKSLAAREDGSKRADLCGYELSACQVETRTRPCGSLPKLREDLTDMDDFLRRTVSSLGLRTLHTEVGPEDMPLDIYPDPSGRYQKITKGIPREVLSAACRAIGTHIHIGMRDHEMALRVYNHAIQRCEELCELGNGSFGERLKIYRQMAPDYEPFLYTSWHHFYDVAREKGFAEDPKKCWTLIRISTHGTIEFRMFGATDSIDRIVGWARHCSSLCEKAMAAA